MEYYGLCLWLACFPACLLVLACLPLACLLGGPAWVPLVALLASLCIVHLFCLGLACLGLACLSVAWVPVAWVAWVHKRGPSMKRVCARACAGMRQNQNIYFDPLAWLAGSSG